MKRTTFFLAASLLILFSCSKGNEEDITANNPNNPGGTTCDTANMKFATNIKPILQGNCYACHSNVNYTISGVKLEDYDDVQNRAESGQLLGTITHAPGYPAMPQGGAKLSDCNINRIRAWIDRGAPNN